LYQSTKHKNCTGQLISVDNASASAGWTFSLVVTGILRVRFEDSHDCFPSDSERVETSFIATINAREILSSTCNT
jgi:hypothetical protein